MTPADIVAERQRLMKLNGASWQDAQAKFKAGNIEAIAVNAETMAMNAREIPRLFPEGSMTADSKAKPEIWQRWPEFVADRQESPDLVGEASGRRQEQGRRGDRGRHEGFRARGLRVLPHAVPRSTASELSSFLRRRMWPGEGVGKAPSPGFC